MLHFCTMTLSLAIISQPGTVALSRNNCEFIFQLTNFSDKPDLIMMFTIINQDGDTIVQSGRPDTEGCIVFNVGPYLQLKDNYAFTYPEAALGGVEQPDLMGKYSIEYTITGVSSADMDLSTCYNRSIENLYFIGGGISADDEAYLVSQDSNWWNFASENQLFLNMLPPEQSKLTCLEQPEKLYWIGLENATEVLQIFWNATDGTSGVIEESITMEQFKVYEITVSSALVQAAIGEQTLVSYRVVIKDFLGEQHYTVDYHHYYNKVFFLFANQYGMWETLWCKGQLTSTNEYTKTAVQIASGNSRLPLQHQNKHVDQLLSQTGIINTGNLLNQDWALWASDIISGAPAYIIIEERLFPVTVETEEAIIDKQPTAKFLSFDIEYTMSKQSKFPNRLFRHEKDILILAAADGSIMTTSDDRKILFK